MRTKRVLPEPPLPALWKPSLSVAVGQMEVRGDIARNARVIVAQIAEAATRHRARLVVFPETALSGYAPVHHPSGSRGIDFSRLVRAEAAVVRAAKAHRIDVVVGTTRRDGGAYLNSSLIISGAKGVLGSYDKMHLIGSDVDCFDRGGAAGLRTWTLAGTRIGAQICFDMRFPEPWRLLALAGARVFCHPSAAFGRDGLWKREAIESNLSSRASENSCWVLSANSAGPHQFYSSRIIDPDGLVIARAQCDAEQVISAAIDPAWLGRQGGLLVSRLTACYQLQALPDVHEGSRKLYGGSKR